LLVKELEILCDKIKAKPGHIALLGTVIRWQSSINCRDACRYSERSSKYSPWKAHA